MNANSIAYAYASYMSHLYRGGERQAVTVHELPAGREPNILSPSELGRCPLRAYFRRNKFAMTHQNADASLPTMMIMEDGKRVGEVWAEALTMRYGSDAMAEWPVQTTIGGVAISGRADMVIARGGDHVVVEVKRSDAKGLNWSWALQMACYMHAAESGTGFLVKQGRMGFDIFTFTPESDYGYRISSPDRYGKEQWARPIDAELLVRISEVEDALLHAVSVGLLIESKMIPDISQDQADRWGCFEEPSRERYPRVMSSGPDAGQVRAGKITIACPWAGVCYPDMTGYSYVVKYDDNGSLVKEEAGEKGEQMGQATVGPDV
jgi:hypothetical protein